MEVLELKNELNNFYNEKEKEYQRQKKELEEILTKTEQEKAEIKIDDVFDIIVRLKESNVSNIMKTMSVENSSRLVQKLERYNKDKQKRD